MSLFLVAGVRTIALSLACLAIWYGWRRFRFASRPLFLTVTAGLLLRLGAGEILFWISFLKVPIGRSLQLGDGMWFFGQDGVWYVHFASTTASQGLAAILHVDKGLPAPVYLQALSSFMYLFGSAASVAILLNACCYLLGSAILVWLIGRDDRLRTPGLIALVAVSFAPGSFLWYLQPLKDPFSSLLLISFIGCLVAWQDVWSRGTGNLQIAWRALAVGAVMFAILYSIAGVRWYVAMTFWLSFPIFLIVLFITGNHHRLAALGAGLLLAVILGESILLGGAGYIIDVRPLLAQGKLTSGLIAWFEQSRSGYERTGGATTIAAGPTLLEHPAPPPLQPQPAPPAPSAVAEKVRRAPARRAPTTEPMTAAASVPDDAVSGRPPAPETTTVAALDPPIRPIETGAPMTPAPQPVLATPQPKAAQQQARAAARSAAPQPPAVMTATAQPVTMASQSVAQPAKPQVVADKRATAKGDAVAGVPEDSVVKSSPEAPKPRKKVHAKSAPAEAVPAVRTVAVPAAVVVKPPQPAPPATANAAQEQRSNVSMTNRQRIITGFAATLLPRAVAQSFGIISVGGGKGLWLLVEADTIVFDAMLLFAAFTSIRLLRHVRSLSPSLLALAISCAILTGGVVYAVSNFGTLFRLRDMVFTELCMLPLVTIAGRNRTSAGSPASESLGDDAASLSRS